MATSNNCKHTHVHMPQQRAPMIHGNCLGAEGVSSCSELRDSSSLTTLLALMVLKVSLSRSKMLGRSAGCVSQISRTKNATSSALLTCACNKTRQRDIINLQALLESIPQSPSHDGAMPSLSCSKAVQFHRFLIDNLMDTSLSIVWFERCCDPLPYISVYVGQTMQWPRHAAT